MAFKDRVSSSFESAQGKMKTSAENLKLTGKIKEMETKIQTTYADIGRKYEELHAENVEEAYAPLFAQLKEYRDEIDTAQEQIRKNKHVCICPQCGAEIAEDAAFCLKCGAANPAAEAAKQAAEINVCPKCGAQRTPGAAFCVKCGEKFPEA